MNKYGHCDNNWFVQNRFGLFIHWGAYAVSSKNEWVKSSQIISEEKYFEYVKRFSPDNFHPEKLAKAAKKAGMRYVVFTTKHHDGFCLFDSRYTDYKITAFNDGLDLTAMLVDAFRAEGFRIGFYHSLIDWHHKDYAIDKYNHPLARMNNYRIAVKSDEEIAEMNASRNMEVYREYLRNSVKQLLTSYGKIDIIWFDFSFSPLQGGKGNKDWGAEELVASIRSIQPDILINDRLDIPDWNGDFTTEEQNVPQKNPNEANSSATVPWEGCHSFSNSWGYNPNDADWKSPKQCIDLLINHVCCGGNLLMNFGLTARGKIPEKSLERLHVYEKWMAENSESIYGCGMAPSEFPAPRDCRYTFNSRTRELYMHVMNWPFRFIFLENMKGKIEYCQFLHDWTEIKMEDTDPVKLHLPVRKPDIEVPVIKIKLKEDSE